MAGAKGSDYALAPSAAMVPRLSLPRARTWQSRQGQQWRLADHLLAEALSSKVGLQPMHHGSFSSLRR
jgi:hypothetical protein